jgi:putative transposase
MRKSRFSEEHVIQILKAAEAGQKVADLVRKHGISEHTFYRWRAKYGGMDVSDAKKLRALEDENRRLKHLVADLTLDNQMLKHVVAKMYGPPPTASMSATDGSDSLRKCIRPLGGASLAPGHDGNPRASVLTNGSVWSDRFFASGSRTHRSTV